ncbi:5'/3'-nucleotidase SurE [Melioribacteraceae bacterium 4301-Me]|uniref:5'/3'-nucleotidase SurE n=1 Tax=Pyranulibacter aquaticus TaxID=3163344 RepID=UPI00359BCBD3
MKILISNDDGINSRGIESLAEALRDIAEVVVVAPFTEQSAVGHAITMKIPLRVTEHYKNGTFFGYAVDGTPADCIKIGIRNILSSPPDIVFSGINHGPNTAINIIYSGTISAAREAAIMDIPAIAISVTSHEPKNFDYANKIAKKLAVFALKNHLQKGTLLNVNVPDVPENNIRGVLLTKQGKSKWDDIYEQRIDPYGKKYYWLTGKLKELDNDLLTDQFAVKNNYVSITPIHFDLTDYKTFNEMKNWNIEQYF